jgi:hypothetical protein
MSTEGAICAQFVRCGKAGCKCSRGELHGPYYYRFTREGGRLRKSYVPKSKAGAALDEQRKEREFKALLGPVDRRRSRRSLLDRMFRKMEQIW